MSIIIKGITKAQFYKDTNKIAYMDVGWDIEELPPHGRLIDADALHEELNNDCEDAFRRKAISSWEGWLETMDALSKAPTIIEAEVKE